MATTSECHRAMGGMIFAFQGLEEELTRLFVTLSDANTRDIAQILISSLEFKGLLDAIGAMSQHRNLPSGIISGVKEVVKLASSASEHRNRYVHSHYDLLGWGVNGEVTYEQSNHTISRRTGIKWDFSKFDPVKLEELSSEITKISILVFEIHDEIRSLLYPNKDETLRG